MLKIDNIITIIVTLIIVWYGIWGIGKDSSVNERIYYWENISILSTLVYTLIIYVKGLFGGIRGERKFGSINSDSKVYVLMLLGIVIFITLPFTLALLPENVLGDKLVIKINVGRISKMGIVTIIALIFAIIDVIMLRAEGNSTIKFKVNLKYSEIPVLVSCLFLWILACKLGETYIVENNFEPFFAGAVAFQMISSNIIWAFNDDKLFEKR